MKDRYAGIVNTPTTSKSLTTRHQENRRAKNSVTRESQVACSSSSSFSCSSSSSFPNSSHPHSLSSLFPPIPIFPHPLPLFPSISLLFSSHPLSPSSTPSFPSVLHFFFHPPSLQLPSQSSLFPSAPCFPSLSQKDGPSSLVLVIS